MEYINSTPYPSLAFKSLDAQGNEFYTAAMRVTLSLDQEDQLILPTDQDPLVMTDEFMGAMHSSSVRQESDLAPYKPWCDVIVIGDACVPESRPRQQFEACVRIARKGQAVLNKWVRVTGPRFWEKRLVRGWKLSEPEPIQSLPLRYEYAYGGECRINDEDPVTRRLKTKHRLTPHQRQLHPEGLEKAPAAHTCCEANPIGKGYAESWYVKARELRRIPAPQIESLRDPIQVFGKKYMPEGFGVIGRSWNSRSELCGTINENFIQSERCLPEDFDFAYWNGAHPDMQVRWLVGDEVIDLINLGSVSNLPKRTDSAGNRIKRLVLPNIQIHGKARHIDGTYTTRPYQIDTLIVDLSHAKVSLIYRLKMPEVPVIQSLEALVTDYHEETILDQTPPLEVTYG